MRKNLTAQVMVAIAVGVVLGVVLPHQAVKLKLVSDVFVRLISMVIAPIVFLTLVVGIAGMGDLKKVGVVGGKALLYFEAVTTLALVLGLGVAQVLQPGVGVDTASLLAHAPSAAHTSTVAHAPSASAAVEASGDAQAARAIDGGSSAPALATDHSFASFVLSSVPDSAVGAFTHGGMLPVLCFSVLFGLTLARQKQPAPGLLRGFNDLGHVFFGMIDLIMKLSPLAAGCAMAYTVGTFGMSTLWALGRLLFAAYFAMALFVTVVLGSIARYNQFSLLRLLQLLRAEILVVLGTSSSEAVLPSIMEKLQEIGCGKAVVGLVVPTGYSFNLDGTSIYLSLTALFIAQVYGVHLSPQQILILFAILLLTSKGAAGVTGSGFLTLAATLAALPGQPVPLAGLALVVGVDRFLSTGRAITNLIGNCVATVVLAKNTGDFIDRQRI
jgi:aerobic C4-dicarboxylate transport protein